MPWLSHAVCALFLLATPPDQQVSIPRIGPVAITVSEHPGEIPEVRFTSSSGASPLNVEPREVSDAGKLIDNEGWRIDNEPKAPQRIAPRASFLVEPSVAGLPHPLVITAFEYVSGDDYTYNVACVAERGGKLILISPPLPSFHTEGGVSLVPAKHGRPPHLRIWDMIWRPHETHGDLHDSLVTDYIYTEGRFHRVRRYTVKKAQSQATRRKSLLARIPGLDR